MSLRIDHHQLTQSLREALWKRELPPINGKHSDQKILVDELEIGEEELKVHVEVKHFGHPPAEAFELVPPPTFLEATDLNLHIQLVISINLSPSTANRISVQIEANVHKPVYNFATVRGGVRVEALKFEWMMNVALVNGHVVVWAADELLLEPSFTLTGADVFLCNYLTASVKKFLHTYFSRMQHVASLDVKI